MSHRLSGLVCWILSAAVHAAWLGTMAFVHFPPGVSGGASGQGAFSSSQPAARVVMQEPRTPKPRIKPLTAELRPLPAERMIFPAVQPKQPEAVSSPIPERLSEDLIRPPLHFFGERCAAERLCFVVDCSGSMFGRMGLVRRQLSEAVSRLTPDQFFSVLFFGGNGRILETGAGRLQRAVPAAKQEAIGLVESVRPEGQTDALPALARAMRLKTEDGQGADLIYFLTDGFDLDQEGTAGLAERAEEMRRTLAPQAVIHTIAFWAAPLDRQVLERMALESGGTFTCVDYEPESSD